MTNNKSSEQALEAVTAIADEIVQKLGMSLVEIHFGQLGRQKSIDVYIYRQVGKVSLADCEQVSRELDLRLDQLQDQVSFFHGPYVLNVSSPGIDRVLKSNREFDIFRGRSVEVKTKTNVSDNSLGQHFVGVLEKMEAEQLHLSSVKPAPQKTFGNAAKGNKKPSHKKAPPQEPIKSIIVPLKQVIQVRLHSDALKNLKQLEQKQACESLPAIDGDVDPEIDADISLDLEENTELDSVHETDISI